MDECPETVGCGKDDVHFVDVLICPAKKSPPGNEYQKAYRFASPGQRQPNTAKPKRKRREKLFRGKEKRL
jgi:hypothetical protein